MISVYEQVYALNKDDKKEEEEAMMRNSKQSSGKKTPGKVRLKLPAIN